MKKLKQEFSDKEIKYIKNEVKCMKVRLVQAYNYTRKINSILHGTSIEETEKKFPPLDFKNYTEGKGFDEEK